MAITDQTTTPATEFAMVDPAALDVAANVRDTVDLDQAPEFVASIREHGVLPPILTVRRADGVLAVIDGQRRTLAAIATDTPAVPVTIRTEDTDTGAAQVSRIVKQIVSNDQRSGLTDGQRAAGIAQLFDLGVGVQDTARALSVTQMVAKVTGRVGGSVAARAALDAGQLSLEHAAVFASFEKLGDDDAVAQLLDAAENRPYTFGHLARRLTEDRRNARHRAAILVSFGEAGHPVLTRTRRRGRTCGTMPEKSPQPRGSRWTRPSSPTGGRCGRIASKHGSTPRPVSRSRKSQWTGTPTAPTTHRPR